MVEVSISNTMFKLHEAAYFLNQMKKTVDNRTEFIFNLIAFVSAARSVTYVMQKQYKKSEGEECEGEDDPFWKWYVSDVREPLKKEEDAVFFPTLRVKFIHHEGNPRQDVRQLVTKTFVARYNIIGSAPQDEEKFIEHNSERESPITITDNPEAQVLDQKYVWYVWDIRDKTKTTRKYVIPTCEEYLQRLTGIVDDCEEKFGQATETSTK
jgi:hypothetical protein